MLLRFFNVLLFTIFNIQKSNGFVSNFRPNFKLGGIRKIVVMKNIETPDFNKIITDITSSQNHQILPSDMFKSASYQIFLYSEHIKELEIKIGNTKQYCEKLTNIGHEIGYMMVKLISSILPHVDSIGHKVLHMDDVIINYFINLDILSPELKKDIILNIIRISQHGDNFGGQMLQLYYDIVNKLM
jgi:hypothetical protein